MSTDGRPRESAEEQTKRRAAARASIDARAEIRRASLLPPPARWVVAFTEADGGGGLAGWLLSWFRPGFRHCLAFRQVPGTKLETTCPCCSEPLEVMTPGGVLMLQLTSARLQNDYFAGDTESAQRAKLAEECGATFAEVEYLGPENRNTLHAFSCVGIVRALAGWHRKVQTPWRLWLEIARREARRLGVEVDADGWRRSKGEARVESGAERTPFVREEIE